MRLDKYLATYGEMSRKEAKQAVRRGRITMDGKVIRQFDIKVEDEEVCVDGTVLHAEEYLYFMLNKPAGVVSATKDKRERTVLDLIEPVGRGIFPVGRLDKDAEGLMLLTDDGALAHRLLSPRYHVKKCYLVEYEGTIREDAGELFRCGIDIGEKKKTMPAQMQKISEGKLKLTISEGRYHQVKRMMAKVGGHVTALKRISMGPLILDETLDAGQYRRLTEDERKALMEETKKFDGVSI